MADPPQLTEGEPGYFTALVSQLKRLLLLPNVGHF